MPAPGMITSYKEPQLPWVRVDGACYTGYEILPFYDSLLAKLVVWGRTRDEAIVRARLALKQFEIKGVPTTIPFHIQLLDDPGFQAVKIYTTYVETELKQRLVAPPAVPAAGAQSDPDAVALVRKGPRTFEVDVNQRRFKVAVTELVDEDCRTVVTQEKPANISKAPAAPRPRPKLNASNGSGEIKSAMNGQVKAVFVAEGDVVADGQKLLILEAMKMETEILSGRAGKVVSLKVKAGEMVEASSVLVVVGD